MLRIADKWVKSDLGRQRQGNEDNYFVLEPLFVVADGMGGAQAGEVASQMAVEAFQPGLPNGSIEDALTDIIREANRRIHDMSRSDEKRQGMGTTCTAAYVDHSDVVIAHVGDSRCYLFRDGELTRLTRDHSLVGELVDRGKLTEEQAELHPQRSVITRALGPEADVQVDTERVAAHAGDLFLLCSDGLTSMIREHGIQPILSEANSLEEAGRNLINAANAAGGRDNITVILFRLDEVEMPERAAATAETAVPVAPEEEEYADFSGKPLRRGGGGMHRMDASEQPTLAGGGEAGTAGGNAPLASEVEAAVKASDESEAAYRAEGTVALSAIRPPTEPPPPSQAPPPHPAPLPPDTGKPKQRRRRRRAIVVVAVLALLAAVIGTAAWLATRAVFFVGTDSARSVSIFRGLPYELPLGLSLYTTHYTSGVTIDQVPTGRRPAFTDHELRTLEDARDLVERLELGTIER